MQSPADASWDEADDEEEADVDDVDEDLDLIFSLLEGAAGSSKNVGVFA